jgi:hypothetical protein
LERRGYEHHEEAVDMGLKRLGYLGNQIRISRKSILELYPYFIRLMSFSVDKTGVDASQEEEFGGW